MKKFMLTIGVLVVLGLIQQDVVQAQSQNRYQAMEGVESVNTVIDFRIDDAEMALGHLNVIHEMIENPSLVKNGEQPEIIVVFIGSSVNLVASEGGRRASDTQSQIAQKIKDMDADGIRFEICMTAAHANEVSPESILPEIEQVGNGWISLIGYQQQGYAMIADF